MKRYTGCGVFLFLMFPMRKNEVEFVGSVFVFVLVWVFFGVGFVVFFFFKSGFSK